MIWEKSGTWLLIETIRLDLDQNGMDSLELGFGQVEILQNEFKKDKIESMAKNDLKSFLTKSMEFVLESKLNTEIKDVKLSDNHSIEMNDIE